MRSCIRDDGCGDGNDLLDGNHVCVDSNPWLLGKADGRLNFIMKIFVGIDVGPDDGFIEMVGAAV